MSAEDKSRYGAQYKIVAEIVAMFEDPSDSDEDAEKGLKIVELMQEVRSRCCLYVAVAVPLACIPVLRFTAIHDRPRVTPRALRARGQASRSPPDISRARPATRHRCLPPLHPSGGRPRAPRSPGRSR